MKNDKPDLNELKTLKELQESMKTLQLNNPMKELRESMKALQLNNPLKELQESMKALQLNNPLKELQESMKALRLNNPMKELQESMKALQLNNPLKEFQESMKALRLNNPMKELQESMKALQLNNPLKEFHETIKLLRIQYPWKELQETMNSLQKLNIPKDLQNTVDALSMERWQLADENQDDIQINNDGSVSVNSKIITQLEIQNAINQVVGETLASKYKQFEKVIEGMYLEIRSLKNTALQKILKNLVYPVLVGLFLIFLSDITAPYREEYLKMDKKQIKKHIATQFSEITDKKELLRSFRFVTARQLNMRSKPTIKSKILCLLHYGQVVELVEKKRNWSHVSWRDNDNSNILQGWVFTRYLEKFQ